MKKLSLAIKFAIPAVLLSTQVSNIQADDSVSLSQSGELELTVTANRRAEQANQTLAPNTVIDQDDIQRTKASSVSELLRRVPGINITNSGGIGKVTSVFMRGSNSGHVLVLVDGVRHGSATLGTTSFQHLPLSQIDRIEIVRGPRSSLYGSEAIGGVIQIFTRKNKTGFNPSVELSAGSNDTFQGNINLGGGNGKTWYNLNAQHIETDGIDACNSTTAGCFADEPDKDGYERDSLSLSLGHAFTDKVKGKVSLLRAEGDNEFDGGFQNESEFVQQVISADVSADVNDALNLRFSLGQSKDESDNFKDGTFTGNFDTETDTASVIADYAINDQSKLLFGADWNDAKVGTSSTAYDVTSRDNTGIFTSYSAAYNKAQVDASVRYDDNEQFGSKTTGGLALGLKVNEDFRAKFSVGTAFKAPTFNQLYFPGFGNANLKPEESTNYEFGFDGQFAGGGWEINVFQNDIENLIGGFPVSNTDRARITGAELGLNTRLSGFDISTNFTVQNPKNRSGTNGGKLLRFRPKQILNIDIDRKFGALNLGTSIHIESARFTDAGNTDSLGGFGTVDLRANYDLSKDWSVGLKVANILDKEYATNKGFNQDGVNGLLSIKYAPK